MYIKYLKNNLGNLLKDKSGNFALITALVLPLLIASGGLAIDIANQVSLKTRFQAASDSVSLTIATRVAKGDLTVEAAEDFGVRLLAAQMANDINRFSELTISPEVTVTEVIDGGVSTWDVSVGGRASQRTTAFSMILGEERTNVSVASVARAGKEEVQGAFSMALVVDVSGSMRSRLSSGVTRLDALKAAANGLFGQFEEADPDSKYVRTGVSTFAYGVIDKSKMEWGSKSAESVVNSSKAKGGTASTNSFKWAWQKLKSKNKTEANAHKDKNGQVAPERFILFMTDGSNNDDPDDVKTKRLCDKARKDGIKVYSIALGAPTKAKVLMQACSFTQAEYYEANTAHELIEAFKNIGLSANKSLTRLVK